jgi:hypothetical protein
MVNCSGEFKAPGLVSFSDPKAAIAERNKANKTADRLFLEDNIQHLLFKLSSPLAIKESE